MKSGLKLVVLVSCFTVLSSGATVAAAPTPAAGPPTKIVASYGAADVVYAPVWVAVKAGIFAKHNLDVDLQYQASSVQIPSLLSGDVKLALVGCTEVAAANASGADLVGLANIAPVLPYLLMVPASIKTPADLAGKTIGISKFGDTTEVASRIALSHLGVKPESVTFVQVGSSSNRAAALLSGAVQASTIQPPITYDLEKHGFHSLMDLAKLRIPAALTLTGQRRWVEENRDVVQRYVDALMEGIDREKRDKAFTIGILRDQLKVDDPQSLSDAYDYFSKEVTPSVPHITAEQCKFGIDAMAVTNEGLKHVDVPKFLDDRFVTVAAKAMHKSL